MLPKNKKIKNEAGIDLVGGPSGKHSPYVINLKELVDKNEKVSLVKKESSPPAKVRIKKEKLTELTVARFFIFVGISVRRFFIFLSSFSKNFFSKIRAALSVLPRLIKFLRFALEDYKKILFFGFVAFIFILPLQTFSYYESIKKVQGEALGEARSAYGDLQSGGEFAAEANFSAAAENFGQAASSFSRAGEEVGRVNSVVTSLLKNIPGGGGKIKAGEALLFSGEKIASAGQNILASLAEFTSKDNDKSLTQKIKILRDHLVVVLPEVASASDSLSSVKNRSVPETEREDFLKLQNGLPSLVQSIKKLIYISDLMVKFLGDEAEKRYLLVFQNPGELRPTGGFMGSLALIDIDRGEITNMEIPGGGSYDFQGSLKEKVAAPEPLRLVNARWQLQDANWFPDFPVSAEKIKWFYEKSGGPTVDGVIAVNVDLVVDLLDVLGPIPMPEYGKVIDKDNFIEEMQMAVEVEYDKKENKPKKIIADLTPRLVEKILASEPKQFGKILAVLVGALEEKNVLLYSVYPEMEHEIKNLGWAGEIQDTASSSDYLMVVHTNIGGGKTDRVIAEDDSLEVKIAQDGYVKNKLTIRRRHNGIKGELFTGVRNVDYLRVYVPAGSKLISAEGFEAPPENLFEKPETDYRADLDLKNSESKALVDKTSGTLVTQEFGKTVFGNWLQVDPGEEVVATVEYLLPFKLVFSGEPEGWWNKFSQKIGLEEKEKNFYQILIQKQPGSKMNLTGRINFPENWQTISLYGQGAKLGQAFVDLSSEINSNKFYSVGFIAD